MASSDRNTRQANLGNHQDRAQIQASRPTTATRHHCLTRRPANHGSGIKYLLYPSLVLGLLWLAAHQLPQKTQQQTVQARPQTELESIRNENSPIEPQIIAGGVILQRDRTGYFKGTVIINDVPMPFLIDTGASHTTLPMGMANMARLPAGRSIQSQTAGGEVIGQLTRADSLKIGNAELRNIDVVTNQHLEEVLIGMNTLKHFRMTQTENSLTLVANSNPAQIDETERNLSSAQPPQPTETEDDEPADLKAPTRWKKSTACDNAGLHCRTVYGH